jgi:hypothetical protein
MNADTLFSWIKTLDSATITVCVNEGVIQYDIGSKQSKFKVGYAADHENGLLFYLNAALHDIGSVVVRQFLEKKIAVITPNGKKMQIPEKNLYMFVSNGTAFMPMDERDVEDAQNTDSLTGVKLPHEEGVHYCKYRA